MKLVAVSETILTSVGLMRPGIPYRLDETSHAEADVLAQLLRKGGFGKELTAAEAAELFMVGASHHLDDGHAPLFNPEGDDAGDAAPDAGDDTKKTAKK